MKDITATVLIWLMIFAIVGLPIFYVYAHVSVCGWKGLFVECRIMDCPK